MGSDGATGGGLRYELTLELIESTADVEIMVYLGILDTRKYFGSQKILTKVTAILSQK